MAASVQSQIWTWGLAVLAASAVFNITVVNAYNWSLVVFEHFYLFMALGYLYLFSNWVRGRQTRPFYALMAVLILLGDAMGVAAVLTSLVAIILLASMDRTFAKAAAAMFAVFFATVLFGHIVLTGERNHDIGSMRETTLYAIENPDKFIAFFTKGLGRGSLAFHKLQTVGDLKLIQLTPMIGAFALTVGSVLTLRVVFQKTLRAHLFPVLLIGFSLTCVVGAVKLRLLVDVGTHMYGDRYYRFLMPFLIGISLLAWAYWRERPAPWLTGLFAAGVGLHVAATLIGSHFVWTSAARPIEKFYTTWDVALEEYARSQSEAYPEMNPHCRPSFCRESVDFLDGRGSLSVTRDTPAD